MAKVFTIAPGLDNLGAMKTGGQGSVYKGRRIGEIITAIKLLPTPIHSESENDKSYRDFSNEVEKLKRVNREPNPHVVKILSSGLSETGNFPFIEMEYIEGPDLEELLKPPHDTVFKLNEVVKVATQLSSALAHCHKNDIKHGDIKSNNVKYSVNTGNYVLLDFGLAVMTDEERRTSLRQAGAIEFMAPEQNEGKLEFQTDVYGFGIIIFELLAGRVPFPLQDKGESARNVTRLNHMETPPPDVVALRAENMPKNWSAERKAREMMVPKWLLDLVYKCLEKKPENRFPSGIELHEFICHSSTHHIPVDKAAASTFSNTDRQLQQYRQQVDLKDREIAELKQELSKRETGTAYSPSYQYQTTQNTGVSKTTFLIVLFIAIGLAALAAINFFKNNNTQVAESAIDSSGIVKDSSSMVDSLNNSLFNDRGIAIKKLKPDTSKQIVTDKKPLTTNDPNSASDVPVSNTDENTNGNNDETPANNEDPPVKYKIAVDKAYFYGSPDEGSKRKAYMVPSDNALLTPSGEENGYIYIVFTNQYGQTSKGWLKKSDLKLVNQ